VPFKAPVSMQLKPPLLSRSFCPPPPFFLFSLCFSFLVLVSCLRPHLSLVFLKGKKKQSMKTSLWVCRSFDTKPGEWQTVKLPFREFKPIFRALSVRDGAPLDPSRIASLQVTSESSATEAKIFQRSPAPLGREDAPLPHSPQPPAGGM
jgi:hypothetical protein